MNEFAVFAKYWESGRVKTRLANSIGPDRAADIYFSFLSCIAKRFADCGDQRMFCVTPNAHQNDFRNADVFRAFQITPQADGDLGVRMTSFFQERFAAGIDRVILIGSDSPSLPRTYVERAFDLLQCHEVVLGPSDDGGYYLIGLSKMHSAIFEDINWSTESVFTQTTTQLDELNISYAKLPVWFDVDNQAGLDRLMNGLVDEDEQALRRLHSEIESIL